ncbi:MAG: AI-2E family transporter [Acidimicrobiia bacterium]
MSGAPRPTRRPARPDVEVHPLVARSAAYAWRLLIIGLAVWAALWLLGRLLVVAVPVAIAVLVTRALMPVQRRLTAWRVPSALAAAVTLVGFLALMAGVIGIATATIVNQTDQLDTTLGTAVDDVETWLVEDSPFDVTRSDVQGWRADARDSLERFITSDQARLTDQAVFAGEVLIGILLLLIVVFFLLKDGPRLSALARRLTGRHADRTGALGRRAWQALGGYLRGAALLGVVEGAIVGVTMVLVGASLAAPVAVLTFVLAFLPIIGAITAGIIAVLVTLATAGFPAAVIVAAVALAVQQLDNDLLAPVIYGRALQLHPLAVLLGIAAGGALFGLVGTVFAVPVLAVAANTIDELRTNGPDGASAGDGSGPTEDRDRSETSDPPAPPG